MIPTCCAGASPALRIIPKHPISRRAMRTLSFFFRALVGMTLLSAGIATHAQTVNTLYTFTGGADGENPVGPLVADGHGNFYGVTLDGGVVSSACLNGCGTVFELTPNGSGGWTQAVIFSFS